MCSTKRAPGAFAPLKTTWGRGTPLSAITRSGSASARARSTAALRNCPVRCRALTAAGKAGLRIEPSGAATVKGAVVPWLFGMDGPKTHFRG